MGSISLLAALVAVGALGCDNITGTRKAETKESPSTEARATTPAAESAPSSDGAKAVISAGAVKAEMHLQQSMTYGAMKDWDNAIHEFTKAADVDPNYTAAYANRAVAYMQQRKYNKAMDDLKRAEGLNPRDKMVHYNFVALHSLQKQNDRALDSLDRALELGFADYDALRADPDLNNVRRQPEFRKVLEKHKVFLR